MVNNKGAPSDSLLVEQELLTIMEHQIEFIPGFGGEPKILLLLKKPQN
jgi:hypothetical protein